MLQSMPCYLKTAALLLGLLSLFAVVDRIQAQTGTAPPSQHPSPPQSAPSASSAKSAFPVRPLPQIRYGYLGGFPIINPLNAFSGVPNQYIYRSFGYPYGMLNSPTGLIGFNPVGMNFNGFNPIGMNFNGFNPVGMNFNCFNPVGMNFNGFNPIGMNFNGFGGFNGVANGFPGFNGGL
jgi:hypothetical protein